MYATWNGSPRFHLIVAERDVIYDIDANGMANPRNVIGGPLMLSSRCGRFVPSEAVFFERPPRGSILCLGCGVPTSECGRL